MCAASNDFDVQNVLSEWWKMEQDDVMFSNRSLRRWWLLKKALVDHNLEAALRLAKEVEVFITPDQEADNANGTGQVSQPLLEINRECTLLTTPVSERSAEIYALQSEGKSKFASMEYSSITHPETAYLNGNIQSSSSLTHRVPAPPGQAKVDEPANETVVMPNNTAASSFAVFASIQEVVTFLRRCNDVVVSIPDGKFLVNGRFQENATELLHRANRIRCRQGKPPFEVLVPDVARSQGSSPLHEHVSRGAAGADAPDPTIQGLRMNVELAAD